MNEQLNVKNFGPIKDATVDFKRVTVFIGPTGGGKSTLAKLAAMFRDVKYHYSKKESVDFLADYALNDYLQENHFLSWTAKGNTALIQNEKYYLSDELASSASALVEETSDKLIEAFIQDLMSSLGDKIIPFSDLRKSDLFRESFEEFFRKKLLADVFRKTIASSLPTYIISERIIVVALEYSWAGLMRDDIGLPKLLLEFANAFSLSRKIVSELDINFLNVKYLHVDGRDFIKTTSYEKLIRLPETASGIQSVTPMLVLLEHLSHNTEQAQSFIIEEPELNLYPTAQQGLLNWLVEKCTKGENDLTITTHSPYILSHLNLLLYAYQVAEQHPERAGEVAELVPRASWLNPAEFACYQVENGGVTSLVNADLGLIDDNGLDGLSGDAADAFDNLIRLSKGVALK